MNPNGLIFGDGFRLDTTASFYASTADALIFDSGLSLDFTAASDIQSLDGLEPASWGFTSGGGGKEITVEGFDVIDNGPVAPNSSLTFVGADVSINVSGGLTSQGRNVVALASGSLGTFDFDPDPDSAGTDVPAGDLDVTGLILSTNDDGTSGDITLWGDRVNVSGNLETASLPTAGGLAQNAGDVHIVADGLTFNGTISTRAEVRAGDITIDVSDDAQFGNMLPASFVTGATSAGGDSGDITIQVANDLDGTDFFATASDASGLSNAGAIQLSAGGTIELDNFVLTADGGDGRAGSISLDAEEIFLQGPNGADGFNVSSDGARSAGDVDIIASVSIDLDGLTIDASNTGTGDGGVVTIEAPEITVDSDFAVDVSAVPPAQSGIFISSILNPPVDPPVDPPTGPAPPQLSETEPAVSSIEHMVSFNADDVPPRVADDATSGAGIDFASDQAPNASNSGDGLASVSAPGDSETDDDEDEARNRAPGGSTSGEAVASRRAPGESDRDVDEEETAFNIDEYLENEPEAMVTSATSEAAEKSLSVPGIDLFTRAEQRAPMLPRTCDVIARAGGGSKLLARNPRRRPISSEDWLIAFDQSGDQLLAELAVDLPAVGSAGSIGTREAQAPAHLAAVQRELTAAAVAIRSDRYAEAAERFKAAVDELERAGDEAGASRALFAFSQLQLEDSRFESAHENLQRALRLAEKNSDPSLIAKLRGSLGNALIGMGDLNGAEDEFNRGIGIVLKSENQNPGPAMLNDLGNRHAAKRDYKSAMWAYQEAATLALKLGRIGDEARARAGAARVAVDVRRLDDAWRLIKRADKLRPTVPNQHARTRLAIHIGHTLATLAAVTNDRRDDALRMAGAALDDAVLDAKAIGDEYSLALAYVRRQNNLDSERLSLRDGFQFQSRPLCRPSTPSFVVASSFV